ncbi:GGDEF domain-containing protein [Mycolicibacterium sp. BiH015]|uniref:GGDEF domain-containing protein n=1 Tax=Mycolicibacterium sp. BiH015 TaxID=3018808 RepID=UPI0022E89271|nr:GGDEF domain-containing protein [Mycolicibacterium sp. BiH015]MDA2893364.1 GGDEF domain-containing protein [Mycolicibacterium sp. BiH015]
MSSGLFALIDLGSFTLIGIGCGFVVLWMIDRRRGHALLFAAAILCFFASNWVLSLGGDVALSASVHGVLLPIGFVLLADGLLRRSGERLAYSAAIVIIVALASAVWYFAYVSPMVSGRIVTQNVCLGIVVVFTAARLWVSRGRRPSDTSVVVAISVLSVGLFVTAFLVPFSDLPREVASDGAIGQFARSPVALGITVVTVVILPLVMLVVLAAIVADLVGDLRVERDRDELTGLLNRRGFTERATVALRSAASAALILADLDFFKKVNDELGHAGGDFALTTFADLLRSEPDTSHVTGRIGGEEFAVLTPDLGAAGALAFAESVRSRLAAHTFAYGGASKSLTASFGVATAHVPASLPELMDAADAALYEAKARGRNCTVLHQPR